MMPERAIFLDKDGTLIENVPYNVDPSKIQFCEGAIEAVRSLFNASYRIFIITNQSGVAHGYFPEQKLAGVEMALRDRLAAVGVTLAGFYYCPHHAAGTVAAYALDCECRKPKPGMLLQAAQEHAIDLTRAWFIGDILNDVEAGRSAGCRTILIDNGNETEWHLCRSRLPHHVVLNLMDAANVILAIDRQPSLPAAPPYPALSV
uniref:D-glycero-alpha-D-manno-heptose-1,7-bisphosphate 7-phosphatase n=2 Tax=Oculatella sp. LEGE 06141 TaxID=1828648 RepID=UPI001D151832|nr:HAD family hydrolase [Oculatella sp. LEGE 06141]